MNILKLILKQTYGGARVERRKNGYLEIPALVHRLGPEDIPEMKEELGDKQSFLDAWSVAW